jgi:hypothetical protein
MANCFQQLRTHAVSASISLSVGVGDSPDAISVELVGSAEFHRA